MSCLNGDGFDAAFVQIRRLSEIQALAEAYSIGEFRHYETLAGAQAAATSGAAPVNAHVTVYGHFNPGDGGDFIGVVHASDQSGNPNGGRIRPVDGTAVTPQMYGGDLAAWGAAPFPKRMSEGVYLTDTPIALAPGYSLQAEPGAIIREGAAWSGGVTDAVVSMEGPELSALPPLAVDAPWGARTLTFASAHGLTSGDVIILENTTDNSLNSWRSYYHDGEFIRVMRVDSPTEVTTEVRLDPQGASRVYPAADCACYALDGVGGSLSGLRVEATTAGYALRVARLAAPSLRDVVTEGAVVASTSLNRCWRGVIDGGSSARCMNPATGLQYGLTITCCHEVTIAGGQWYGTRHGLTLGSDSTAGAVPSRGIKIQAATIRSESVQAADGGHGCHIGTQWIGCDATGYIVGGADSSWRGGTISTIDGGGSSTPAVLGSEIHNLNHLIEPDTLSSPFDGSGAATGNRGIVDFGGNHVSIGPSTQFGGALRIKPGRIVAPNWGTGGTTRSVMQIINRGFPGADWRVEVDVGDIEVAAAPYLVYGVKASGSDMEEFRLTRYAGAPGIARQFVASAARKFAPIQVQRVQVAASAGSYSATALTSYDFPAGHAPRVWAVVAGTAVTSDGDADRIRASMIGASTETATVFLTLSDSSDTFGDAQTIDVDVFAVHGGA